MGGETKTIRWWMETGQVGGDFSGEVEVPATATAKEMEEAAREAAFDRIDWGWTPPEPSAPWPAGCLHQKHCWRKGQCLYGVAKTAPEEMCPHVGRDIAAEVEAAGHARPLKTGEGPSHDR